MVRRVDAASPCEPRIQDEGDAPGLAASCRVGILDVVDANAEAGDAGAVPNLDPCPGWCRSKRTSGIGR